MRRVLVCGGRDYADAATLNGVLDFLHAATPFVGIMHGGASGADTLARDWARSRSLPHMAFPADWSRGPKAGPERNARMLKEGKPDFVIAFAGVRGTEDMKRRAREAGVDVWEVK